MDPERLASLCSVPATDDGVEGTVGAKVSERLADAFRTYLGITCAVIGLFLASRLNAADTSGSLASVFASHPAADALQRVFAAADDDKAFTASHLTRQDYASLMAADVDYFKGLQRADGAIIDPYTHSEVQYSTPAFAAACAVLVKYGNRQDLLEPATRALSCAITALVTHHAANGHSDFYIPMIMFAYRDLKESVPADLRAHWEGQLGQINIADTYRAELRGMNWNIVSSSGELLRRQDGLVQPSQLSGQMEYLETSLAGHLASFTRFGMYKDPGAPLAYDEFARIWLEEVMASGAYDGKYAAEIRKFLQTGGLSSLLILSPTGEWPCGGRSACHNWNEAAAIVIFENNANLWKKLGRMDVAGAFKRAAHLSLMSLRRWQRPSGELWIIKNRADPAARFAYETYSEHTQYNLLPMAMLAMAYQRADDTIIERPAPAEVGGYVFDLRETFHKVVAAAGGYYALIDTDGDPHYNATGLQRVQKAGVDLSPLSDSTAAQRAYGSKSEPMLAMSPGLQWQTGGGWRSLADYSGEDKSLHESAELKIGDCSPVGVGFELDYTLAGPEGSSVHLLRHYVLGAQGVACEEQLTPQAAGERLLFPALVNDGERDLPVTINGSAASIDDRGSILTWTVLAPATLKFDGPRIICHNGFMQPLIASLTPAGPGRSVRWRIELKQH